MDSSNINPSQDKEPVVLLVDHTLIQMCLLILWVKMMIWVKMEFIMLWVKMEVIMLWVEMEFIIMVRIDA